MAETSLSARHHIQPPPAPPLPPNRAGVFQRIIAPLSFNRAPRHQDSQVSHSTSVSPRNATGTHVSQILASPTIAHRTGLEIAAIDVNDQKTHAILAGKEILKTVKVQTGKAIEDVNLRSAVYSSATAHQSRPEEVNNRRQFLPAKDVRWSHGQYSHVVATAAQNGRIALYDVSAIGSSRVELSWLYLHTGQVNKLDFDPHRGYMLLSGSQDKTCKIWDIRNPRAPSPYNQYNVRAPVRDVRWSPTDAYEFALCTENGVIQKWDVRNPSQAQLSINAHEKACYTIGWHADGKHLVSGGLDKHLRVWDFKSENRRQKPMFQLRTPQAIMNLAWRPPCWSTEFGEASQWQSTQIATGYTSEDPRVHVWDLRRPLLPFRELDQSDTRPTDMLWAADNLLWTVGNAGIFTQTDTSQLPRVDGELTPCAMDWFPDGSFVTFAEERHVDPQPSITDHASHFLNVPQDKLSGEDGIGSRSLTDEEESELMMGRTSRRPSKGASTRSAKSQGSSPPVGDGFPQILSLDKAVNGKSYTFHNGQIGTFCQIDGLGVPKETLTYLSDHYSRPMTEAERKANPETILEKLEQAFAQNADVCDVMSMHRTAQSWRILSAIIVPELKEWADRNRKERQAFEIKRKQKDIEKRASLRSNTPSPFAKLSSRISEAKSPARSDKTISNLFRSVVDPERNGHDAGSSSNMTTPIAKPLPDSPAQLNTRKDGSTWFATNDAIEPMVPLPPSVMNSHSTAAAASMALLDTSSERSSSATSSPEKIRQPEYDQLDANERPKSDGSDGAVSQLRQRDESIENQRSKNNSHQSLAKPSPVSQRVQEERRAAFKDYKPQVRQVFTLEEPVQSPKYRPPGRHDSEESFPMFSASTDSSRKATSWGRSLEVEATIPDRRKNPEDWQKVTKHDYTPPSEKVDAVDSKSKYDKTRPDITFSSDTADFASDSPEMAFSMDGAYDSLSSLFNNAQADRWMKEKPEPSKSENKNTSSSTLWKPEIRQQESASTNVQRNKTKYEEIPDQAEVQVSGHGLTVWNSNPNKNQSHASETDQRLRYHNCQLEEGTGITEDLTTSKYLHMDFRPIDFKQYEPKLPFAWSSLPVICYTIEFDLNEGVATGFFSANLLMHIYPFFFHQSFRAPLRKDLPQPISLAERLMRPDLSARIIEGIFARHIDYLKKMKLYLAMAELRKLCVEFDYPNIYDTDAARQPVGAALKKDTMLLYVSCSHCHAQMAAGENNCRNCKKQGVPCPICEQVHPRPVTISRNNIMAPTGKNEILWRDGVWTFCHKCGHSGHVSCMSEWFSLTDIEGQCPTRDCGCDCGPGLIREQRISRQKKALEDSEAIRTSHSSVSAIPKRDPHKVSPSPAVDRARNSLRGSGVSFASERGTQSGDESLPNRRHSSIVREGSISRTSALGRTGSNARSSLKEASFGNRPRVRVVTPGEENS